jgi:hypothetical protein
LTEDVTFSVEQGRGVPTKNEYLGRNGYGKCCGVEIWGDVETVRISPITSQGGVARCHIEIPNTELEKVIEVLRREKK